MKNGAKLAIVVLLALAVGFTFVLRGGKRAEYVPAPLQPPTVAPAARPQEPQPPAVPPAARPPEVQPSAVAAPTVQAEKPRPPATAPRQAVAATPRLLELGSMRCMACLEMAKVLDALRASQGPRLQVDFIDVFEQSEAADRYEISLIPTQILYDGAGKEIFRHTGYFSHDDILAKFRELGVKL